MEAGSENTRCVCVNTGDVWEIVVCKNARVVLEAGCESTRGVWEAVLL